MVDFVTYLDPCYSCIYFRGFNNGVQCMEQARWAMLRISEHPFAQLCFIRLENVTSFVFVLPHLFCLHDSRFFSLCSVHSNFVSCCHIVHGKLEVYFFQVLNNTCVSHAGLPRDGLMTLCPNVVDLDISGNFFNSWEEIFPILSQLPKLQFLNLSRNRIQDTQVFILLSTIYIIIIAL